VSRRDAMRAVTHLVDWTIYHCGWKPDPSSRPARVTLYVSDDHRNQQRRARA
jgi:hypothetical protein